MQRICSILFGRGGAPFNVPHPKRILLNLSSGKALCLFYMARPYGLAIPKYTSILFGLGKTFVLLF